MTIGDGSPEVVEMDQAAAAAALRRSTMSDIGNAADDDDVAGRPYGSLSGRCCTVSLERPEEDDKRAAVMGCGVDDVVRRDGGNR